MNEKNTETDRELCKSNYKKDILKTPQCHEEF